MLGGWTKLFLLTNGDKLVSFLKLSAQDCILESSFIQGLGFFHTAPEYRGNHYGKHLSTMLVELQKKAVFMQFIS